MRALCYIAAFGTLAAAGCLRTTTYKCTGNEQCGADGVCEPTGFCSFVDANCTDGRRYAENSGSYSSTCVGDVVPGEDGGVVDDGSTTDTPPGNCPGTYVAVGSLPHRYRVITNAAFYQTQRDACDADATSAYLAVPDDATELQAILQAANVATIWVGIDDRMTEMTFATANGGTFPSDSALWAPNEPDNGPETGGGNNNGHCVIGFSATMTLADERCDRSYAAVCECDP